MSTTPRAHTPPAGLSLESVPAADALRTLTAAVQELSLAKRAEDVQRIVPGAARRLTGADGATFARRDGEECFHVGEGPIEPLWKGKRFPLNACISGWTMLNRRHVVIEDTHADYRIPLDADQPTFVKSLAMVPIRPVDPVGAIGMYWARHHRATEQEIGLARALADSAAVALEHVQAIDEPALTREPSDIDPLTRLPNRRAWEGALADALDPAAAPLCVALIDLDGSDDDNDLPDHPAGNALLQRVAETWRAVLRDGDLLAHYGKGQFAVLLPDCDEAAGRRVAERLCITVPGEDTASIGLAFWDGDEVVESLLGRADATLSEAKAAGGARVVVAD